MWDGPDGMGIGRVGDAMRSIAMGMGWDLMLCVAMPGDWISSTMDWVDQLWLVALGPLRTDRCSAACSLVFDDGAVICCSLVGFDW